MKSEREKMLAGGPYVAADTGLAEMNARAQTLPHAFNTSHPSASGERVLAAGKPCRLTRSV